MSPRIITIYTHATCKDNPGPGGWGAILSDGGKTTELYGGEPQTTNNRMAMTAVIKALGALETPCKVILRSDSQLITKGASMWLPGWKAKGWRKAKGEEVENIDLWMEIDHLKTFHDITWKWVQGHKGDAMNGLADFLAFRGLKMQH